MSTTTELQTLLEDVGLNDRVDGPARRRCLRCGRVFWSSWSGNRICGRCKGSSVFQRHVSRCGLGDLAFERWLDRIEDGDGWNNG